MVKIAIFGVGLIGGSLALCLKGKSDYHVVGHSNNPKSIEKYLKRGVVDEATTSMEDAARDADFIFLCVPVGNIEGYLEHLSNLALKPGCIITDVGSTKGSITRYADSINRDDVYFIGGHPMAGSERSGVEAASYLLFENAFYVLTPNANVPEAAYSKLSSVIEHTRAQIIRVDAELHDDIVGAISHLPHIIAVALVNQISQYNDGNELYQRLAAGGFRDITRIASCDPSIWRDILINNKAVLLKLLKDWNHHTDQFIHLLEAENGEGIFEEFAKANAFRSQLPERRKGMITSLYDVYVDIADTPGVIGKIASELGNRQISLSNIQIIEVRVDVPGILRLSFRNEKDMDRAVKVLKELNYAVQQ
jgi:prephenate dehydrogenase